MSLKVDGSQVASITYGVCMEMHPCLHQCTITLNNGEIVSDHFDGVEIRNILEKMPADKVSAWARQHFMSLEHLPPPPVVDKAPQLRVVPGESEAVAKTKASAFSCVVL